MHARSLCIIVLARSDDPSSERKRTRYGIMFPSSLFRLYYIHIYIYIYLFIRYSCICISHIISTHSFYSENRVIEGFVGILSRFLFVTYLCISRRSTSRPDVPIYYFCVREKERIKAQCVRKWVSEKEKKKQTRVCKGEQKRNRPRASITFFPFSCSRTLAYNTRAIARRVSYLYRGKDLRTVSRRYLILMSYVYWCSLVHRTFFSPN